MIVSEYYLVHCFRSSGDSNNFWLDRSLPSVEEEITDPTRHLSARMFAKQFPTATDAELAARRLELPFEIVKVTISEEVVQMCY